MSSMLTWGSVNYTKISGGNAPSFLKKHNKNADKIHTYSAADKTLFSVGYFDRYVETPMDYKEHSVLFDLMEQQSFYELELDNSVSFTSKISKKGFKIVKYTDSNGSD